MDFVGLKILETIFIGSVKIPFKNFWEMNEPALILAFTFPVLPLSSYELRMGDTWPTIPQPFSYLTHRTEHLQYTRRCEIKDSKMLSSAPRHTVKTEICDHCNRNRR